MLKPDNCQNEIEASEINNISALIKKRTNCFVRVKFCSLFLFYLFSIGNLSLMIDLIIAYLALIVVILLFIIAFLTLYIVHERRKTTIVPLNKDKRIVVPLLTLKTNDRSSGDHSNSATLTATRKRMTKRFRHRVKFYFSKKQFFF